MPTLTYKIPSKKNAGLVMSPAELLEIYFFGISFGTEDGKQMSQEVIEFYIRSAQEEIENHLNLKLIMQIIDEKFDFLRDDFRNWGFLRMSYPVVFPHRLMGKIGEIQQIEYPPEWLSSRVTNDGVYSKNMFIVPAVGAPSTNIVVFSGVTPHLGLWINNKIPNYWQATYCTGFTKMPTDMMNVIGKLAAINLFHIKGDLILGAGIASQSIGIDGLSQSISTTSSATNAGYGARIINYMNDLKINVPRLEAKYRGIEMMSM